MWALEAIARLGPATVPWIETLRLDWRALAFAGAMSAIVALLSGALPAWRVARAGLSSAGRSTSTADPSQHRLRAGLVVAEIAVALVLLSGAGLLLRSFVGLMNVDPGFQRDRVLVAQVFAYDSYPTAADLRRFFDTTIARLSALPAVQHAGAVSAMPFIESNINIEDTIAISGRPPAAEGEAPRAYLTIATPGYFDAMRIPLKDGPLARSSRRRGREARRRHQRRAGAALLGRRGQPDRRHVDIPLFRPAGTGRNRRRRRRTPTRTPRPRRRAVKCSCRSRRCRSGR